MVLVDAQKVISLSISTVSGIADSIFVQLTQRPASFFMVSGNCT
jgi:hypothetical protein